MSTNANEVRLRERTAKRTATADRKRKEAEAMKDEGNVHFRAQRWDQAIECYEKAILTYGPRVTYLNNLAAAYLKVKRYEEAELAAHEILKRDPKNNKARWRRALARKGRGLLRSAMCDLVIILYLDDSVEEAMKELCALKEQYDNTPNYAADDCEEVSESLGHPDPEQPPLNMNTETPVLSDSSDFEHEGNSVPCHAYNHDGCTKGKHCSLKHAPDDRSVRDKLGRNVCLFNMLSLCKFSESQCHYSHDSSYLPPGPWSAPGWAAHNKDAVEFCGGNHSAPILETLAPFIKVPIRHESFLPWNMQKEQLKAWEAFTVHSLSNNIPPPASLASYNKPTGIRGRRAPPTKTNNAPSGSLSKKASAKGGRKGKSKHTTAKTANTKGKGKQSEHHDWETDSDGDDEMEERMANHGFTKSEVFELACQGVKPWDDDAWDVLHALSSL